MELDLVELDENYYKDDLFFKDPDALTHKFNQLEEQNLFYIDRIQEYEQSIEDAQVKIDVTQAIISKKVKNLQDNKQDLEERIQREQAELDKLKKATTGSKIMDQNPVIRKIDPKNKK